MKFSLTGLSLALSLVSTVTALSGADVFHHADSLKKILAERDDSSTPFVKVQHLEKRNSPYLNDKSKSMSRKSPTAHLSRD